MNFQEFEKKWNEFALKAASSQNTSDIEETIEDGSSIEVLSFLEEVGKAEDLSVLISDEYNEGENLGDQ